MAAKVSSAWQAVAVRVVVGAVGGGRDTASAQ
jgi:hypothetical protein